MKILLTLGFALFAMTFCGLSERLKGLTGSGGASNSTNTASNSGPTGSGPAAEKPTLTTSQQAIQDAASETKWDDQGLSWKLPSGWKKMDVGKETFNYNSPENAALLVNISSLAQDFPVDISLKSYYDQAVQQMRNGKYETVRMLELDGIKGVEWLEAPPEGKDAPRRHQWIGYRSYLGQTQMLNVMTTSRANNFPKHADQLAAILYSMKTTK